MLSLYHLSTERQLEMLRPVEPEKVVPKESDEDAPTIVIEEENKVDNRLRQRIKF